MIKNLKRRWRRAYADFQSRYWHDWIFIHINKTGGSSIEKALGMQFDHRSAREKIAAIGHETWRRKFTFSIVRNPWDKVVSHYHYRLKTAQAGFRDSPPSFKDWVRLAYAEKHPIYHDQPIMFATQMDWVADDDNRILVNYIGRFETLDADFNTICQRIGRNAQLPHLKASKHEHYRNYYDDTSREIIATHFARDVIAFNYDF